MAALPPSLVTGGCFAVMTACRNGVMVPYEVLTVGLVVGVVEGAPPRITGPGQGIF